jgi:hypothetical protein
LLSEAAGGLVGCAFDELVARALAKRADQRFATAGAMRDALRAAAAEAAASPLATMVGTVIGTVVRDAAHHAVGPADDARVLIGRSPGQLADATAPVIRRDAHGQARLVDALSLYVPDAAPHRDAAEPVPAARHGALPLEVCNAAQHLLARRLGPVAGVLVKRAAECAGGSHSAFVAALLAELPEPDRAALRAELQALPVPSQRAESGR